MLLQKKLLRKHLSLDAFQFDLGKNLLPEYKLLVQQLMQYGSL
jgi:hypothetical protein